MKKTGDDTVAEEKESKINVSTRLTVAMKKRVDSFADAHGLKSTEVYEAALKMFFEAVGDGPYAPGETLLEDLVSHNRENLLLVGGLVDMVETFREAGIEDSNGSGMVEALTLAYVEYWAHRNAMEAWESISGSRNIRKLLLRGMEDPDSAKRGLVMYPLYLVSHLSMILELATTEHEYSDEMMGRLTRTLTQWEEQAGNVTRLSKMGASMPEIVEVMKTAWQVAEPEEPPRWPFNEEDPPE